MMFCPDSLLLDWTQKCNKNYFVKKWSYFITEVGIPIKTGKKMCTKIMGGKSEEDRRYFRETEWDLWGQEQE